MPLHIRNPRTEALVRELASRRGVGVTEAVELAVSEILDRDAQEVARKRAVTQALIEEYKKLPRTGLKADKGFYDELSGD